MADIFTLVGRVALDMGQSKEQLEKLNDSLKENEKQLQKTAEANKQLSKMGAGFMAVGASMLAVLGLSAKAAAEEEQGIIKLSTALKNVGVNYDEVKDSLEGVITATQNKTAVADDAQREALGSLVTITGDYNRALKLLPLTLDLARGKGMDFASAAQIIGRVSSGNTSILARYGIQLKEGASATEALGMLQKMYAGQAEAYGKSTAGAMENIKNKTSDLMETIGSTLLPIISAAANAIGKFIDFLNNMPKPIKDGLVLLTAMAGGWALLTGAVILFQSKIPPLIAKWLLLNATFLASPIGWITLAVAGLAAAGIVLWQNWDSVVKFFQKAWTNMKIWAMEAMKFIVNKVMLPQMLIIEKVVGGLVMGIGKLVSVFNKEAGDAIQQFAGKLQNARQELTDVANGVQDSARASKTASGEIDSASKAVVAQLKIEQEALRILGGRLQEAQADYDKTKESNAGYNDEIKELNTNLREANYQLGVEKDKLDTIQKSYDTAKGKVDEFQRAVDAANRELQELSNPRLEGMQEYENKLFNINIELKKLELLQLQSDEPEKIQERIDALEKQRKELELQRDIKFDPLIYSAKESVETIQGLNNEIAPKAVIDRIAELGKLISPNGELGKGLAAAQEEFAAVTNTLNTQKGVVEGWENTIKTYQTGLNSINHEVQLILDKKQVAIDGLKETETKLNEMVTNSNIELAKLEEQGGKTIDPLLTDSQEALDLLDQLDGKEITITQTTVKRTVYEDDKSSKSSVSDSSLTKMANGGIIPEPTYLVSQRTGLPYAIAGEKAPERVTPNMGGNNLQIYMTNNVRNDRDIDRIGEMLVNKLRLSGIRI